MSSRELSEWIAYDKLDLIPDPWRQTGIMAGLTHNMWAKKKVSEDHYIPREREIRILSGEDGRRHMMMLIAHQKAKASVSAFKAGRGGEDID